MRRLYHATTKVGTTQTDSAAGEFCEPWSSAVNSLRGSFWDLPDSKTIRRSCAACRPLEMYRTTQELILDQMNLEPQTSDRSITAASKYAEMKHIAEQAKRGCLCCSLLHQVYEKTYATRSVFWCPVDGLIIGRKLSNPDAMILHFQQAGAYTVEVEVFYEPSSISSMPTNGTKTNHAGPGDTIVLPGIEVKPRRPRITKFSECRSSVTKWLHLCEEEHSDCRQDDDVRLPTRVVDVGTTMDPRLRLHESHGNEHGTYIALSHCWGDSNTVPQTNLNNIDQYKDTIPESDLSKTFIDAIESTRESGCEEDWSREAAKMGEVYSQAFLTLAAVSSIDGNGGLFQEPDLREIRLTCGPNNEFGAWLRLPFKDELFSNLENTNNIASEYPLPLLTRKWAFQERLLSRRIIYFADGELAWECRTATWCQCEHKMSSKKDKRRFARGIEITDKPSLKRAFTMAAMYRTRTCVPLDLLGYEEKPIKAHQAFWERLVMEYSQRRLTFPKDNLPALSGIAQAFAGFEMGKYHAGMWESHLPESLCWMQPHHTRGPPSPKPVVGHAPSWSWASSEYPVDFLQMGYEYAKVVSVATQARGPDEFGPVDIASSVLELEAPAINARLTYQRQKGRRKFRNVSVYEYAFHFQSGLDPWYTFFFSPDFQLASNNMEVWLLCLGRGPNGPIFMVITKINNASYERIGLLQQGYAGDKILERTEKSRFRIQ